MAKAPAKWTTIPSEVVARTEAAGTFRFSAPLLDNGVRQLTLTLTVDAQRVVRILVHGEPSATIAGFEAWSDI